MDVAECKAAAIEVGFVGGNANDPHRQTENDRPHGCRRQTFGPPLWINDKPNSPTRASNVHSVVCKAADLGCGPGNPGPSGCDNQCGSTAEDLGCGCGEPGPSGCDNQCGSKMQDLGFGCGVDVGYAGITSGTCASNGYSDIMDVAECKAAAIEVGFVGGNANDPHRQTENDRPHGCRRQTFGPPLWINDKPNSPTRASNVHSVVCKAADLGCGPGNPGPSGCDNQCGSTAEDLGCGCGNPGPSGCDNQCGSTMEDLGFGCGETYEPSNIPSLSPITSNPSMHPSIVPSSTPSALPTNRPSVAPTIECAEGYELKQGMPMHGRGCTSEGISCTQRVTAEECAAMCSNSEHCVAYSQDQGSFGDICVTVDTSVYYRFNVHTRGFHQGEGTYCEKAHTTMRPFEPEAKFTTSEPGQSCKEACESIEEECRADMLFLQSAEEVASWALAANVTCTSIVEKCSWAVAPLFDWSHPEFTNNELVCTFCSEPEPEWKYGAVCNARFGSDTRICPCSSTWSSAPTKTPTSSPTDLPTIQPSVSPTFSQPTGFPSMSPTLAEYVMVADATSCEEAGMYTITTVTQCAAAVSALGFAENYDKDDVATSDYFDRKDGCIWHAGGNRATLFSGSARLEEKCNYQGYAGCLCARSKYIMVVDANSCEAAGMNTITTTSQCAQAVSSLGLSDNYDSNAVKTSDYFDRKDGCIWHAGAKEATVFSDSTRVDEPCNYQGYAGCLCARSGYEGSMCNVDDDCDSERCNFGEFPPRCRQKETHSSECNRDGDCESDLCLGRKCVDGRDNDRCNSNDDCQSGRCAYGIPFGNCQAPAEHGEKCIRNNDCASQHCLLSTCTDHRDGAHCANDDDCLEGSSCVWSKTGATCKKNHGCTWWNWNECSEKCTWFQKVTFTCY